MEFSKRQTEIIKAAVQIVSINGIQALTTKSLAEYIGISEPALYRHFKNKSEIIRAMLMQFDVDLESLRRNHSGWELVKAFFTYRIEQVMNERYWANIIFSEELFIHTSEYSELLKEMMHRHRNIIMENIVIASKNGVIRSDIAPEIVFRILAGSLRLLIKQYGMSDNSFDLCSESTILFNTWDTLFNRTFPIFCTIKSP